MLSFNPIPADHPLPIPIKKAIKMPFLFSLFLIYMYFISWIFSWVSGVTTLRTGDDWSVLGVLWQISVFHLFHASLGHLFSNIASLLILCTLANMFFPLAFKKAIPYIWFGSGFLLWLIGRPGIHVGASAFIYGVFHLIFWLALIRRDKLSILAGFVAILIFGNMVFAFIPTASNVSWEGHLAGAVFGFMSAILFFKEDIRPPQYKWNEDVEGSIDLEMTRIDREFEHWKPGMKLPNAPVFIDKTTN